MIEDKIKLLKGPILIIGASGFIGANIFKRIFMQRNDVFGTALSGNSWRIDKNENANIYHFNKMEPSEFKTLLDKLKPKTIFDCSSFGGYYFENNVDLIHKTNFFSLIEIFNILENYDFSVYVHSGSSSEYGLNSNKPSEISECIPNSHYSISKLSASNLIKYYGFVKKLPLINLRLYSVYGPYEEPTRLIPVLCKSIKNKNLPLFADKNISRDFIFIDDVIEIFIDISININPKLYGQSFNVGTGREISLEEVASVSKKLFLIKSIPKFNSSRNRSWDTKKWSSNTNKAKKALNWQAKINFEEGLKITYAWWSKTYKKYNYEKISKLNSKNQNSISAVVACYKDEHAIPIMYDRLCKVFKKLNIDYEIIFVNDCSPDESENIIRKLSSKNPRVIGISHSRNFGSQAAFLSGIKISKKESCVLLDGDLQDPPEVIESFVRKWREGNDIVYGVRVKREMPKYTEFYYKLFYYLFSKLSSFKIPQNAGDFSLIDRKAIQWILQFNESDYFLRGIRAYVGFKQTGVDYVRPERKFGKSTNSILKNIGWAKKAIFSYSNIPLNLITLIGFLSVIFTICLMSYLIIVKFLFWNAIPEGITFVSILIMLFGSVSLLSLGLLGEYIGKVLEETKKRPRFIVNKIIERGKDIN